MFLFAYFFYSPSPEVSFNQMAPEARQDSAESLRMWRESYNCEHLKHECFELVM